ncbi:hypothetical protein M0R45_009084 [Rubus argutus]|uniref:Uncharacterized protein n=1 Tax=Rubus argutus TaxID=59490 RepID=A0AAW1Y3J0_RUBAR
MGRRQQQGVGGEVKSTGGGEMEEVMGAMERCGERPDRWCAGLLVVHVMAATARHEHGSGFTAAAMLGWARQRGDAGAGWNSELGSGQRSTKVDGGLVDWAQRIGKQQCSTVEEEEARWLDVGKDLEEAQVELSVDGGGGQTQQQPQGSAVLGL